MWFVVNDEGLMVNMAVVRTAVLGGDGGVKLYSVYSDEAPPEDDKAIMASGDNARKIREYLLAHKG